MDSILFERGVYLIPDVLCNAGGVTVSYFEWDVGLHYIGQVQDPESQGRRIFDCLTDGRLEWVAMPDVYDRVFIGDQGFDFVAGTERFRERMNPRAPLVGLQRVMPSWLFWPVQAGAVSNEKRRRSGWGTVKLSFSKPITLPELSFIRITSAPVSSETCSWLGSANQTVSVLPTLS